MEKKKKREFVEYVKIRFWDGDFYGAVYDDNSVYTRGYYNPYDLIKRDFDVQPVSKSELMEAKLASINKEIAKLEERKLNLALEEPNKLVRNIH